MPLGSYLPKVMLILPMLLAITATHRYWMSLLMVLLAGVLWDSFVVLSTFEEPLLFVEGQKIKKNVSFGWGYSIYLFVFLIFIQSYLRRYYQVGRFWLPLILNTSLVAAYFLLDYFLLVFVRGSFYFSGVLLIHGVASVVLAGFLSVFFFVGFYQFCRFVGWDFPNSRTDNYDKKLQGKSVGLRKV